MYSYKRIAKILRTDEDNIRIVESRLAEITGKENVMDKIVEENDEIIVNRLGELGLNRQSDAKEIYNALINKIEADNNFLFEFFGKPSAIKQSDWEKILSVADKLAAPPKGFFLKTEKAEEFLRACPPKKIVGILGYRSVDEMLRKENLFEIYSALRFIEDREWLNNVFFKQYETLRPDDFEYRKLISRPLSEKWAVLASDFIKKKYHNISHLKELGFIFVIPAALNISGEIIRNFSLILHYFNEVPFYSSLFENFAKDENNFSKNLISLLRGDVAEEKPPFSDKNQWLIVQRYLAKDDENDWRLFVPHVNPEALHWERAERALIRAGKTVGGASGFSKDFFFWQDLNWVGDYFKTDVGMPVLVSFNLVDTAMSLVSKKEMIKYLYHHQESLWNKIFIEYFGEEKMENVIKENIIKGWFEI